MNEHTGVHREMTLKEYMSDLPKGHQAQRELAALEAKLTRLIGLFGDYDYVPSIEACEVIWDTLMVERIQMELRLSEAKQLLEDGGTGADWEGRVAIWLGITA